MTINYSDLFRFQGRPRPPYFKIPGLERPPRLNGEAGSGWKASRFSFLISTLSLCDPQGDQEVKSVAAGNEPAEPGGSGGARAEVEPDKFELPPESDEEYMVVEEADASAAGKLKKTGLTRIESFKATFSKQNMSKTRENLGTKVNKLGERIVTAERREKIRQSGERLKQSGERLKETISKGVPAKLNLKKERTVAEGQEGADAAEQPAAPPKGRAGPDAAQEGKAEEAEVPMYDMKQLS